MIKKVLVALTTAGLTTALIAAAPGAAQAAECEETDHPFLQTGVTPTSVVIGTQLAKTVDLTATTTVPCNTFGVYTTVGDSHQGPSSTLVVSEDADSRGWTGKITITPSDLDNAMAGNVDTTFFAYRVPDEDEVIIERVVNHDLHLYRAARLTVNAAPEPVKKGQTLTVTGALQRANWDEGVYQGYRNRKVRLMFRTANSSYSAVKTVTSGAGGQLKATVKADKDGYYTWDWAGNSTTAPARPAGDRIDVR
jgi:hypothetical protein